MCACELDCSTLFVKDDAADRDIVRPDASGWLWVTEQQVCVLSASGVWHAPEAPLECWDGEPPPAADWPTVSEALTWFSTGRLSLWPTIREYPLARFDLGGPGLYRVRAHTGDRDRIRQEVEAAAARRVDEDTVTVPLCGVERFLIQFWPAPPSDTRDQIDAPGRRSPEAAEMKQFEDAVRALGSRDPRDPDPGA